jgi:deazaflavin-dependent oxidoreductase (nitroreductase family)
MTSFNDGIIAEFRADEGRVGGYFEGATLLLLTTTGVTSGLPRTSPLVYREDGGRLLVFGTNAGAADDPQWYRNLLAQPRVTVEVGTEAYAATATPLTGEERARQWKAQVVAAPSFGRYETMTTREFPVVALQRAEDPS